MQESTFNGYNCLNFRIKILKNKIYYLCGHGATK